MSDDATLRVLFAATMLGTVLAMKFVSRAVEAVPVSRGFWVTPIPSVGTWAACPPWTQADTRDALRRLLIASGLLGVAFALAAWFSAGSPHPVALAYVAAPVVLLFGEAGGPFTQLVCAPTGVRVPLHHRLPLFASTLTEFWGTRWNTWVSDWFRSVIFRPLRHRPVLASLLVFLYSGLWHELLINVPLSVVGGSSVLGTMLVYFLIQWVGVLVDRKLPGGRRLWMFVVVAGPAPLFLNESALRVLMLWPA